MLLNTQFCWFSNANERWQSKVNGALCTHLLYDSIPIVSH
jgi:hypothetical protein